MRQTHININRLSQRTRVKEIVDSRTQVQLEKEGGSCTEQNGWKIMVCGLRSTGSDRASVNSSIVYYYKSDQYHSVNSSSHSVNGDNAIQ